MLRRRKHGTTDRLALPHQHRRKGEIAETVRSAPGRGSTDGAVYTDFRRDGKGKRTIWGTAPAGNQRQLDTTGSCSVFRLNFWDFQHSGAPMTAAFTFPGQGSQAVGMGKALAEAFPAARAVFDEVDAALGEKLTTIVWDGPAETLQLTENAQPALMAVSLATLRVLETEAGFSVGKDAAFVAGHSLGEYSALAAAGGLSISDTARLLRTRGVAMQKAVPVGVGAMAALLGLDYEAAMAVADEAAQGQVCQAANDNGGGQVVVSGDKAAVERALEIAKTRGARRAMLLPVSAPFHCRLMQPAADVMAKALAEVAIKRPVSPLVSNVLATPISDPDEIRRRLIEQVTGTVRWRESVAYMASHGVTRFFEIGAGKVLSGLVKRIADGAVGVSVGGPGDIASAKDALAAAQTA
jgi:[acyl-carrier-protein] S-malonyltransferase